MTSLIEPFPIRICTEAQSGRFAIASRDIPKDSLVLRARAFGIATSHPCRKECCSACFNANTMASSLPYSCPMCSSVYYCSAKCQQIHLPLHSQYECSRFKDINIIPSSSTAFDKLLASIDEFLHRDPVTVALGSGASEDLTDLMEACYDRNDIMSLARWILNFCVRVEIEREFGSDGGPTIADYLELVPNDESLSTAEKIQFHGLHRLFAGLKTKQHTSKTKAFSELFLDVFPTVHDLVRVISIRQCNGFGLWDAELECMGNAVYPAASFFNHSCEKNLERQLNMRRTTSTSEDVEVVADAVDSLSVTIGATTDDIRKREIWKALNIQVENVLLAKRDIKEGERLTHSYIDGSVERERRRNELKETYYFDCLCEKCERGE